MSLGEAQVQNRRPGGKEGWLYKRNILIKMQPGEGTSGETRAKEGFFRVSINKRGLFGNVFESRWRH